MELQELAPIVRTWQDQHHAIALATVVQTWGSSPRRAGAKLVVNDGLGMAGSVSGGCVEADVAATALDVLADGQPRLLSYSVADDTAWGVGLACGGDIAIWVEPLDMAWWNTAQQFSQMRHASVTLITANGRPPKAIYDADGSLHYQSDPLPPALAAALPDRIRQHIAQKKTGRQIVAGFDVLIDVHHPAPRLILIGGAHVAQALHSIGKTVGFRVWVIDPRKTFATAARFPAADAILHQYPEVALPTVPLDADSFVVVLSHDPKIDDPALLVALRANAAYVGVMSSHRTHQRRVERLLAKGLTHAELDRIYTPVGLDINADTPAEIALSIMAQIVALRNQPT